MRQPIVIVSTLMKTFSLKFALRFMECLNVQPVSQSAAKRHTNMMSILVLLVRRSLRYSNSIAFIRMAFGPLII